MSGIAIAGSGGSGSIVIGTTTIGGGTDTCVLFQKGTVVGEDTNLEWNYTTKELFISGANNPIVLGPDQGAPTYNLFSMNGVTSSASGTNIGINAGATGDPVLYLQAAAGGGFQVLVGTNITEIFDASRLKMPGNCIVEWAQNTSQAISTTDLGITRDSATGLAMFLNPSSPTVGTGINVYNTTDTIHGTPTNYERGVFDWTTNPGTLTIGTQKGGTGSTRNIQFVVGGTAVLDWGITASGTWTSGGLTGTNEFQAAYFQAISSTGNNPGFYLKRSGDGSAQRADFNLDGNDNPALTFGVGTGFNITLSATANHILAISNNTAAMGLQVYNTIDVTSGAPTNYERATFDWTTTSNTLTIGTQKGGSGSTRNIQFVIGGTNKLDYGITAAGNWTTPVFIISNPGFIAQNTTTTSPGFFCGLISDNFDRVNFFLDSSDNPLIAFASGATAADLGISRIPPVSSVPTIAFGNATNADASATIKAKTKAGAPTAADVPAGTWVLIRDTTNATTKLYYNNAGTLQTVALV